LAMNTNNEMTMAKNLFSFIWGNFKQL